MKGERGGKGNALGEEEPHRTAANGMESRVDGAKSARSSHEAGSQCDEREQNCESPSH